MKKLVYTLFFVLISVVANGQAKYVFYFIGDGMGVNQVNGTEMYQAEIQNGRIGVEPLLFTQFPVATVATTFSAKNSVTDSAAAGTALATGKKTYNGAISVGEDKNATFILAKLLPYWLIGFVVLTICFILAWVLYGITPVGHFLIIYFFAVLFVLSMSGLGLVISNHSATMQQSMFVMWFCMLVLILMSGLFTPISSMPEWAQVITVFNPLKYLMQVMRMVYLKGSGMADLLPQLGALLAFALVLNIWAVKSFKKVEG